MKSQWISKWHGLVRRMLFLSTRAVMRRTGFAGARRVGPLLGAMHYHIGATERRKCHRDLAVLQGRDAADPLIAQQLRQAYRINTMAMLEVLAMVDRKVDVAMLRTQCRVDGMSHLEIARQGRGAILLATHSGNSLLLPVQLASEGWSVTVVYRHADMMSAEFFSQGLPRYGIQGILANEGFKAYAGMIDALRRGRILFAMMDQGVKHAETGVPLRFLGKNMPMPGGVVQLARQTRAPILPVATLGADPIWHFSVEPRIELQPGGTVEEDMGVVAGVVERQILAHPELWTWHLRRWRDFPLAAA
jgi:lauroyl/myristoyl acyltransferase